MDTDRIPQHQTKRKRLRVYTVTGTVEIPLTGNPGADAILRRFAARSGAAVREMDELASTLQQEPEAA